MRVDWLTRACERTQEPMRGLCNGLYEHCVIERVNEWLIGWMLAQSLAILRYIHPYGKNPNPVTLSGPYHYNRGHICQGQNAPRAAGVVV